MKINVGSPKNYKEKNVTDKSITEKKPLQKKRYTQTQLDNFHTFVAKVESIEQGYIKHML